MQLRYLLRRFGTTLLIVIFGMAGSLVFSQPDTVDYQPVDVHFLMHYYEQDGDHAAVTGGIGTQELTDIEGRVVVNIPLDSSQNLIIDAGLNHYTSASTDRIDSRLSSASAKDSRASAYFTYQKTLSKKRLSYSLTAGGSIESDYISGSLGGSLHLSSRNQNRTLSITGRAFFDTWIVIFPEELRAPGLASVPTDKRNSYQLGFIWSQVISKRLQGAISVEAVLQTGLLATAFHRVYFAEEERARIEKLPTRRFKLPLGIRLHYYAWDFLILKAQYRFYVDDFGIVAHSIGIETPIRLGPFLSFFPFYRYHSQSAARYFQPYKMQQSDAEFYTSDYDLAALQTQKLGLGFLWEPLYGIIRFGNSKTRSGRLQSLQIRGSGFWRSDGLRSWMTSLDLGFRL